MLFGPFCTISALRETRPGGGCSSNSTAVRPFFFLLSSISILTSIVYPSTTKEYLAPQFNHKKGAEKGRGTGATTLQPYAKNITFKKHIPTNCLTTRTTRLDLGLAVLTTCQYLLAGSGMVHQPNGPSSKALGKRPMRNVVAAPSPFSALSLSADSPVPEDDECSSAPSTRSVHTRYNHKRVLPSRVRRGGVGSQIGTNDIDVNLLDMLKRKGIYSLHSMRRAGLTEPLK